MHVAEAACMAYTLSSVVDTYELVVPLWSSDRALILGQEIIPSAVTMATNGRVVHGDT
jgi:hypothetical protein